MATAPEEALNPTRDVPLGIGISVAGCTVLYVLMALVYSGKCVCPAETELRVLLLGLLAFARRCCRGVRHEATSVMVLLKRCMWGILLLGPAAGAVVVFVWAGFQGLGAYGFGFKMIKPQTQALPTTDF